MVDKAETPVTNETKRSLRPLILWGLVGLAGAGGGFFLAFSGMATALMPEPTGKAANAEAVAFVPIDPILISVASGQKTRTLRFSAQIEVDPPNARTVQTLMPRILDVLNTYLRAVDPAEFDKPTALLTVRGHMLRRINLVVGDGVVKDLLITEFVYN